MITQNIKMHSSKLLCTTEVLNILQVVNNLKLYFVEFAALRGHI